MVFARIFFLTVLFGIFGIQKIQAEETDQFTLPPGELQDIGPAASHRLYEVLEKVIAQTNSEMQMLLPRAQHSRHAASQLALRRNDSYLADLVYKYGGPGFPRWLRPLPKNPSRYSIKKSCPGKLFIGSFFPSPPYL